MVSINQDFWNDMEKINNKISGGKQESEFTQTFDEFHRINKILWDSDEHFRKLYAGNNDMLRPALVDIRLLYDILFPIIFSKDIHENITKRIKILDKKIEIWENKPEDVKYMAIEKDLIEELADLKQKLLTIRQNIGMGIKMITTQSAMARIKSAITGV